MSDDRDALNHSLDATDDAAAKPTKVDETVSWAGSRDHAKPALEGLLEEDRPLPRQSERLGRYRLERVIGSGGMGVVYEALDEVLRRRVAIKVLGPGAQSQVALERFQQEALLTARLNHPHVVVVHEAGQAEGRAFIAMEYVDGWTLERWIDRRLGDGAQLEGEDRERARRLAVARLDRDELRAVCRQIRDIADALHHGHTYTPAETETPTPIIHRDVKPGNIMIDRHGEARLLDFGLAKELGVALTVTREALGTPLYMSPEQLFSAKRVGPRSDVYSLGMTLYACLTLARPFELSQPGRLFEQLMHEDPRDPRELNPVLPDDLRTIVLKATAKDERERYGTAADLAADLDAYLEGREIQARPPGLWRRARRKAARHKRALLLAGGLALTGVIGLGVQQAEAAAAERAAVQRTRELEQARWAAQTQAERALSEAAMVFELAAENKAEAPTSERWMRLLSLAYGEERKAFEQLAEAGAAPSVGVRRLALLARLARNDAKAYAELVALRDEARAAVTRRARLEDLDARLAALDDDAREALGVILVNLRTGLQGHQRAAHPELVTLAAELIEAVGGGSTWPFGAQAEFAVQIAQAPITHELAELGPLAAAEPTLTETVDEVSARRAGDGVVRVDAPTPAGEGRVRIERHPGGEQVAAGRPGEALRCDAWGPLRAVVRVGAREARVRFDLPRPQWGAPPADVAVRLAAAPDAAPAGMRLVQVAGVDPFWIDETEVTVADYARFLAAVGAGDHTPRTSRAQDPTLPVTGITYFDALAYCAWAGKQLPTRAQWAAAAFAGDAPSASGANLPGHHDGLLWSGSAGAGPQAACGARGLVGNVAEWILRTDDDLPFAEAAGGSWASPLPPAERGFCERFAPTARGEDVGFRCVVPLPPPARPEPPALELTDPIDGRAMVLVPGGVFDLLPPPAPYGQPKPSRGRVEVSPFQIDHEPVSAAAFLRFLEVSGHTPQARQVTLAELAEDPSAPARVPWEDAQAYARWAGKRLPTEAEWEAAYRGRQLWGQGPDGASFGQPEWCQDLHHPRFFDYAPRRDPVSRWGGPRHVTREGAKRRSVKAFPAFRCVRDIRTQEAQ